MNNLKFLIVLVGFWGSCVQAEWEELPSILNLINQKLNQPQIRSCQFQYPIESQSKCSPALESFLNESKRMGLFRFYLGKDKAPKKLCSAVEMGKSFTLSAASLEKEYRKYLGNIVPPFEKTQASCLNEHTQEDQLALVNMYYFSAAKLQNQILTDLVSLSQIDSRINRSELKKLDCRVLQELAPVCFELQKCPRQNSIHSLVAQTEEAMKILSDINKSPLSQDDKEKARKIIFVHTPWLEGKVFEKLLKKNQISQDELIGGIVAQLESTSDELKQRVLKKIQLMKCLKNQSDKNCEHFVEEAVLKTEAIPLLGNRDNRLGLSLNQYQGQVQCMAEQIEIRNEFNQGANDLIVATGLTLATWGMSNFLVGPGIIASGTRLGTFTAKNASQVQQVVRTGMLAVDGAFLVDGINQAKVVCEEELNQLKKYSELKAQSSQSLCSENESDPHHQLVANYRTCIIASAFAGLGFLPFSPYLGNLKKIKDSHSVPWSKYDVDYEISRELNKGNKKVRTVEMDPIFQGENMGEGKFVKVNLKRKYPDEQIRVVYFNQEQREAVKVFILKGKIYDHNGKLVDTTSNKYGSLYVIDKEGQLYILKEHKAIHQDNQQQRFHHSSILSGEEVISAGHVEVSRGIIRFIDNDSGHYRPDSSHLWQGVFELMSQNLDVSHLKVVPKKVE